METFEERIAHENDLNKLFIEGEVIEEMKKTFPECLDKFMRNQIIINERILNLLKFKKSNG